LKRISLPKVAVLATGLTAAILVAMMGPSTAQAYPSEQSKCSACHSAASGPVTAIPSATTMAANTAYTVLVTPPQPAAVAPGSGLRTQTARPPASQAVGPAPRQQLSLRQ